MVEQRQSAMQRIQVGVIGLVVVLLFVTLASMVLDRVSEGPQGGGMTGTMPTSGENSTPDEPLAELGVTPVAKDDAPQQSTGGTNQVTWRAAPAQRQ